ncbi:MAG: SDR family oxidoreductase [Dehalococcoidales bacterium]|nr:SDR family oxidoreductase [Dehalococcoidales bacterium]
MKKALVTGGAGFIGSHLSEELSKRGYQLVILDNLSTGKGENIADLIGKKDVEFIKGSITDLPLLQKACKDTDYVFHLAAIASVPRSVENPQESHEVNVTGTLNVLIAARDNKVKKVVNTSSCAIYGDAPGLPKKEDMPVNPLSPYAVTKMAGEEYCQIFQKVYHLPTVSLRYFNIFGPRQNPDSEYSAAIPKFIKLKLQGKTIEVYGDGKATRDYVYVSDAVTAFILAAESDASGIYNIGAGKSTTVNELVELISRLTGNNTPPVYGPPRPGDIVHSLGDASKARTFGYSPSYSLEEGLKETIRYMTP